MIGFLQIFVEKNGGKRKKVDTVLQFAFFSFVIKRG